MEYTYTAISCEQQAGAPPMYVTSIPVRELLQWADAPEKRESFMAGYQRDLKKARSQAITDFLEKDPRNILPGALIVAVRDSQFSVSSTSQGPGVVEITIDAPDTVDPEALRLDLVAELQQRLDRGGDPVSGAADREGEDDPQDEEESALAAAELDELAEGEQDDEPDSYLGSLLEEVVRFDELDAARQAQLSEYFSTFMAPGLILDGQHRANGAKEAVVSGGVGPGVYMPVVLLPGLELAEQVFHFYVLNNKAKPLNKTELRAVISTSLTRGEIRDLYNRFKDMNIDANETEWTWRLHRDEESPFRGRIDFALPDTDGTLDEAVMFGVVKAFLRPSKPNRSLFKGLPAWEEATRDDDERLRAFYTFWTAVAETYPEAWAMTDEQKGNLWMKVTMSQLQVFVLKTLRGWVELVDPPSFSDLEILDEHVRKILRKIPEEFFTRTYAKKSLDHRDGREEVLKALQHVYDTEKPKIGTMALFKSA